MPANIPREKGWGQTIRRPTFEWKKFTQTNGGTGFRCKIGHPAQGNGPYLALATIYCIADNTFFLELKAHIKQTAHGGPFTGKVYYKKWTTLEQAKKHAIRRALKIQEEPGWQEANWRGRVSEKTLQSDDHTWEKV